MSPASPHQPFGERAPAGFGFLAFGLLLLVATVYLTRSEVVRFALAAPVAVTITGIEDAGGSRNSQTISYDFLDERGQKQSGTGLTRSLATVRWAPGKRVTLRLYAAENFAFYGIDQWDHDDLIVMLAIMLFMVFALGSVFIGAQILRGA